MIFRRKQPKGTEAVVHIEDLIIPPDFKKSHPSQKKYDEYEKNYIRLGYLDEPITVIPEVNENGKPNKLIVINGYIRYKIAKDWNIDEVPVKYKHEYIETKRYNWELIINEFILGMVGDIMFKWQTESRNK